MDTIEEKERTSFDYLIELLEPKEDYAPVLERCRQLWDTFPREKQREIYRIIKQKKKERRFVDYNPLFAIQKNATAVEPKPTFLHGRALFDAMNQGLHLVQVDIPDRTEGRYPICTREDAERFHLKIIRDSWESVSEPTED